MIRTALNSLLNHTPWWLYTAVGVTLVVAPAAWLGSLIFTASPTTPNPIPSPRLSVKASKEIESPPPFIVPARVWTVTLVDDLFPELRSLPVAKADERPPFRAELVAVTGEGVTRRAFVRDVSADDYLSMSVGDRLASGAEVTQIDSQSVVFAINGTTVTLDLAK